jgi:hypothetical protein
MYWDETLETLFVAGSVTTVVAADFHSAIVKVRVSDTPETLLNSILPAAINAAAGQSSTIFASDSTGLRRDPRILKIRTMHTSTGKTYLIVNGGIGDTDATVGNQFYALRYDYTDGHVVQNDATRAEAGSVQLTRGTALIGGFQRTGGAGVGQSLDGDNVNSLNVGAGPAPWAVANAATDMEVVGDTVYVSLATARDATNDPGVWASTAMFNKDGVVIGWTSWERVMPSDGIANFLDMTYFFAVDAASNKLWTVSNDEEERNPFRVNRTAWTTADFAATSLPGAIEANIVNDTHKDITCVLDLPEATPGLGGAANNAHNSFVMFGAHEKVIFARTTSGNAAAARTITLDFSAATDFLSTALTDAGTVRSLGWTRRAAAGDAAGTRNYFLAGTDTGLWVYRDPTNEQGYNDADGLTVLNVAPFVNGANTFEWVQFSTALISGPVTQIDCDGTYIYVVEQDVTSTNGIVSKLWRITRGADVTTMEGNATLIAQSGLDGIPANTLFTGFSLGTDIEGTNHGGVITTNKGAISSLFPNVLATLGAAGTNPGKWLISDGTRAYHGLIGTKRVPTALVGNDGAGYKFIGLAFEDSTNGMVTIKIQHYNYYLKV